MCLYLNQINFKYCQIWEFAAAILDVKFQDFSAGAPKQYLKFEFGQNFKV